METILIVSGQVVSNNSKINWPDLNYPGSGLTILRTIHKISYLEKWVQLDASTGPIFESKDLPPGVSFYKKI